MAKANITHDPAHLLDAELDGVPDGWRQAMQLMRPLDGLNLCHVHGQPGADWALQSASAPNLTIGLLLAGRMEAGLADGQSFCLQPGQALLLATGQHACGWNVLSARREVHLLNINLSAAALRGMTGMTGMDLADVLAPLRAARCGMAHVDAGMATVPVSSTLHRIAAGMTGGCAYPDQRARNLFVSAKVAECLAEILNRCALARGDPAIQHATPGDRPRLLRARALLEARYAEAWRVPALAQVVGLNEKRLQAGFRALYGGSVHDCLTRIRLDRAQALLAAGHSVTATAHLTGFASLAHFSKVFGQRFGVPPKRWSRVMLPATCP